MKLTKKIVAFLLTLVLTLTLVPEAQVSAAPKMKLNKARVTVYVGKTIKLKVKNKRTKKKVKWKSTNKKVATVTKKGRVKAKKAGKATIIAKIGNKKLKCRITVKKRKTTTTTTTTTKAESDSKKENVQAEENTILKDRALWKDCKNLYTVDNDVISGDTSTQLYRFQNNILSTYSTYDFNTSQSYFYINLFSLETGALLGTCELEGFNINVQALDEYIVVHSRNDNKVYLLDDQLSIVKEYCIYGEDVYLDSKGETAYIFTENDGIKVYNLTVDEETVMLKNARSFSVNNCSDGHVAFTYIDVNTLVKNSGILNLETGEFREVFVDKSCNTVDYGNGVCQAWLCNEKMAYLLDNGEKTSIFYPEELEQVSLFGGVGHTVIVSYTESYQPILSLYDNNGEFLSTCTIPSVQWMGMEYDAVWFEEYNGYFFTQVDNDGQNHLFFWDLSVDTEGKDLELKDVSTLDVVKTGTEVAQEYYDRAEALSEKYGVKILIADQCNKTIDSYTVSDRTADDVSVGLALDELEKALNVYPKGFMEQLHHEIYREIEIHLYSGQISNSNMDSIINGFVVYSANGKVIMGLDGRNPEITATNLEQTIYHEFSHIIDSRLEFEAMYREEALYSEEAWVALNPEGFEYTGDGDSVPGASDGYSDYFIDDYACTDSGEDRARTLEYAMMAALYPDGIENYLTGVTYMDYFDEKVGLVNKLKFYSDCIRDSFDTTGWPEETLFGAINE